MLAARIVRVPGRVYHLRGLRLETAGGIQRVVLKWMERLTGHAATHVLSVSSSLAHRSNELDLFGSRHIYVLGSGSSKGVDTDRFAPRRINMQAVDSRLQAFGLEPGPPVIGFVGRIVSDKGVETLLDAVELLHQRGISCSCLLAGRGDDPAMREWLRRAADLPASLCWVGEVPAESIYELSDIICLPSRREGFPNVALEASASRLPLVVSDATGCVDAVRDGDTGLIFRVNQATDLADKLQSLVASPAVREMMGASGRAWVEANFDTCEVAANHNQFFRDVSKHIDPSIRLKVQVI